MFNVGGKIMGVNLIANKKYDSKSYNKNHNNEMHQIKYKLDYILSLLNVISKKMGI